MVVMNMFSYSGSGLVGKNNNHLKSIDLIRGEVCHNKVKFIFHLEVSRVISYTIQVGEVRHSRIHIAG